MDGTTRLSRDGEPVFHYSFLSSFAERSVVRKGGGAFALFPARLP